MRRTLRAFAAIIAALALTALAAADAIEQQLRK